MKKSKVLLVEDEATISELIVNFLSKQGYEVSAFSDGPEALEHLRSQGLPHLALLDLKLPSMHGFELASKLKQMADVPVIFVSSSHETDIIVEGLKKYAKDFIVKPFELRELEVRIQVVLSRMPSLDYASEPIIQVDEHLQIDFAHKRLVLMKQRIDLTTTEASLLHLLLDNAGRVVENHVLIEQVWSDGNIFEDTLRVHMHRLRRKLEAQSHYTHYIRNERGVGYMFAVNPTARLGEVRKNE